MNVKERLKEFIKGQGLTIKAFEASIDASNGYVNSISKGIGADKLDTILEKYPKLDLEWLLTGSRRDKTAHMERPEYRPHKTQTIDEIIFERIHQDFKTIFDKMEFRLERLEYEVEVYRRRDLESRDSNNENSGKNLSNS